MQETHLYGGLREALLRSLRGSVVLKYQGNRFVRDVPDFSCSWMGVTTWIEVKLHKDGRMFEIRDSQHVTCLRLAKAALCYYVVYVSSELSHLRYTLVVEPAHIHDWGTKAVHQNKGIKFDHEGVAEFIRRRHIDTRRGGGMYV